MTWPNPNNIHYFVVDKQKLAGGKHTKANADRIAKAKKNIVRYLRPVPKSERA